MKQFENRILKDLYESVNGLYAFTFYSRYKVEPKNMFNFIDKYASKDILIYSDDRLQLTDKGKKFVLSQLLFNNNSEGKYSNIPNEYFGEKIEINKPYVPKINYLAGEILNKKIER